MDRMIQRAAPVPVEGYAPPPERVGEGLWVLERRLRHFGLGLLPSRTTLARTGTGGIAVISPPAGLDDPTAEAITALGPVESIVLPNSFHYLYAHGAVERFPEACLLAAPGLAERVPTLGAEEIDPVRPPSSWAGSLELAALGPVQGLSELLFFHLPSKTLVLTDLAFHMQRYPRRWDRFFWRASGIPAGFGPGRTTRNLLLRDRGAAARALGEALSWPFEQIVVAHGDVVRQDAPARLREAFREYTL